MEKRSLLEGKKVILVDDEPDVLENLEELLPMCDVTKASNFEEGRKLLEERKFDIAILDIMGVKGYRLLKIANEKNVMAVMLTAHAFSLEDTVKSYKEGAVLYLPKEKMIEIETFLLDVLEAKKEKKNYWWRWLDKLDSYYKKKFGADWQQSDEEFWKKFESWIKK